MLAKIQPEKGSELREGVRRAYSAIADDPHGDTPFPTGRDLALGLGYPQSLIASLPDAAVDAFAGVSHVSLFAAIPKGSTVLDLGCGAGMDSLIASKRTGIAGRVIGVDFSDAMLDRARAAIRESGVSNVELRKADAESLPPDLRGVDVALVNGIFNLNPQRERIFCELARVLRPGGTAYAAELTLVSPLSKEERTGTANWFS